MDALKVMSDLGLEHTMLQFLDSGIFQSKLSWKKAVQENLKLTSEQLVWLKCKGIIVPAFLNYMQRRYPVISDFYLADSLICCLLASQR